MIDSQHLLQESKKLLKALEKDIRERLDESPELDGQLKAEWEAARAANRTAGAYLDWREENITQSAVHWILACVFLRFLEDNDFLARAYLTSVDKEAREAARDDYERYFRANPNHSDLEYLLHAYREVSRLPGLKGLYDERHNPLFRLLLSGDGGITLLSFWKKVDPESGVLVHDFTDPSRETRFLGDLYQDLSESAKDRYALLQTPKFVEEFILDRTLTPAIETFGHKKVRLIDPTCGSGHFLLGAFQRLFDLWAKKEPVRNLPDLVQQSLNAVSGVDINPFAVEIARFRLIIAALTASDIRKLKDAPDFRINLATGDSLLHGPRFGLRGTAGMFESKEDYASTGLAHAYKTEDLLELGRILGQQYHAVVGNPPYITPRDAALKEVHRSRFGSCHGLYSLGVPFTERFFDLALSREGPSQDGGFVGMITANSFMKREFGKRLIEHFMPTVDITHVVDTSGAYIPGHGTPTVILFGRHRKPIDSQVRTVTGLRGEPRPPDDPASGLVWQAIIRQIDHSGSESEFVSVTDRERAVFGKHPWTLGGGGASDIKTAMEEAGTPLSNLTDDLGFICITKADDVFVIPSGVDRRKRLELKAIRSFGVGEDVRDWTIAKNNVCIFPYDDEVEFLNEAEFSNALKLIWPSRAVLLDRKAFGGQTYGELGRLWYSYGQIPVERFKNPKSMVFAFVATHNHFVLDRGHNAFSRTAPVIKLPAGTADAEYAGVLAQLNSSVACFWMKQVMHDKGNGGIGGGIASEDWERFYEFTSTALKQFPLTHDRPVDLGVRLNTKSVHLMEMRSPTFLDSLRRDGGKLPTRSGLHAVRSRAAQMLRSMIADQEELDWRCYRLYGLLPRHRPASEFEHSAPPELALGERAFEIVLARRLVAGEMQTTWFERHGSTPITQLPAHWPDDYRAVVERRIALIESDRNIGLIEQPEYKRRWNTESWEEQEQRALREWLLDRLETERYWQRSGALQLRSVYQLSDAVRSDADFMQVAALYTGRDDFDVSALVAQLTESEAVPYLAAWRYTDDGLRKREAWEETWALQRGEDAVDEKVAHANPRKPDESDEDYRKRLAQVQSDARLKEIGEVAVPPKYKSSDFRSTTFWRLRGALDVPKERFISYPAAAPDADGTLLLGWAGWDHLQQATALAGHYLHLKENEGWAAERLIPLLAGLLELVPWLKQWQNQWNPEHDARMGDYFEGFVQDETRALETTIEALQKWRPPTAARRRRRA
jgi:hypothetical protein